jgi:DNA mismatch endonuclease (patch repair protein)
MPFAKGKFSPLPWKDKISKALKRRHTSPSTEFKVGHPPTRPKGIHPSDETKRKISETLRRKYEQGTIKSGFKKGYIPWSKGKRKWNPKIIQCACGCGKKLKDRDSRGRIRRYTQGHNRPWLGKHRPEKTKEKLRVARLNRIIPKKDTSIEKMVQNALKKESIEEWVTHYPVIGQPDIAFPERKVAIFCDGCYWHNCPSCGNNKHDKNSDQRINEELKKQGWKVLRFWEHEIRENLDSVIEKIKEVLN